LKNNPSNSLQVTAIIFSIAVTIAVLNGFASLIASFLRINYDWKFELCMILGMIIFQYPFIHKFPAALKLSYYYQMLLVSLRGSLLLCPLLLLNSFWRQPPLLNIAWFGLVVLYMFVNHKKKVISLSLPWYITYTWVLYPFLILILII
jgi:hypothetical protein